MFPCRDQALPRFRVTEPAVDRNETPVSTADPIVEQICIRVSVAVRAAGEKVLNFRVAALKDECKMAALGRRIHPDPQERSAMER